MTTPSNTEQPILVTSSKLLVTIWELTGGKLTINEMKAVQALFQAHQQELLSELLGQKELYERWVGRNQGSGYAEKHTAVPVSVIQSKIGELNG